MLRFVSLSLCSLGLSALLAGCSAAESPVDAGSIQQAIILDPTPTGTALAVPLFQGGDPHFANLTVPADAPTKGMWSATQAWPLNGLHSVLLPNGKVLTYGTPTGDAATQDGRYYDVWDPSRGFAAASHQSSYNAAQANSFCSSSAFLANGTLMVSGGNSPLDSTEYQASSGATATSAYKLADERWYGTLITLADGRPLMLGGSTPYGALRAYQDPGAAVNAGTVSMTPEVYTPGVGWQSLFGAYSREAFGPDFHRYWYPRSWVSPTTGEVFGISSETMWFLNPTGDGTVRVAGAFKTGVDATSKPNIGPTSSAVMFAPGRILQVGGNGYHDGHATPSSALATVVDITSDPPVVTETAPMSFARQWPSSTVLPDGRVVVTGGTRFGNNGAADAVYDAELWNPSTGTWQLGAKAAQVRVYHSAAILLPNGTVLSTGGGAPGPVNNLNAELYYPPYLFRAAGAGAELAPRPLLTGINALQFSYGSIIELDSAEAANVSKVVLIGASEVTHSFNTSQRYVPLDFTRSGDRLTAVLPTSAYQAPPGYYVVYVVDAAGVPSPGVLVAVGADTAPPPVATKLPRGANVKLNSVNMVGYSLATDAAGLATLKQLTASSTAADEASAQFVVRDGLADSNCVSLESAANAGQFLRHQAYRLKIGSNDNSALFKADATFCPEAGLSGTGISFRSKNFPANALRHRTLDVWIDPVPAPVDATFAGDASFTVSLPLPTLPQVAAPPILVGSTAQYAPNVAISGAQYSWTFGDGAASAVSTSPATSHAFTATGSYLVTLKVQLADGRSLTKTLLQAVYPPLAAGAPRASSGMALEPRGTGKPRLWVVNPDNDSVSAFDTANNAKVAEITVGAAPRSVAVAPNGKIWVVNRDAASLSIIDPTTLAVTSTVALPRASAPYGLVFTPSGSAGLLALSGTGVLAKLDPVSGAQTAGLSLGSDVRQLAVSADSARLLVSRFVTPPATGEGTASLQTATAKGQVFSVAPGSLTAQQTFSLLFSTKVDGEAQARGVPNYLGAPAISPDGKSAWVPSKQDNIARGTLRDGQNIDFQDTVRAISSRIDLTTLAEDSASRIDHDNAGMTTSLVYHPTGSYLFAALESSRQVAVLSAFTRAELFRVDVGRAPQALAMAPTGTELYVSNFMDRSVTVVDLSPLVTYGESRAQVVTTLKTVTTEKLSAAVLNGKQLFYDAKDPRLARDAYMSCATCHEDGRHDGRTWDLTGLGEGLRNTVSLRGRAGAQSLLHWSGNFDEVQDFEGQIRTLAQGTGLMSDAQFNTGTRNQPLGNPKAGVSTDLDALAAYVKSLAAATPSPFRNADGSLTTAAVAGRSVFGSSGCPSCHNGSTFADEGVNTLRNIGTIKASSGKRLGATLTGIDTPSLRDIWATGPYLHDGSAASISAAISAHNTTTLTAANLANLAAFIQQLDPREPGFTPPSGLTSCATENATCTLPAGKVAVVYYGASSKFFSKQGVTGSIACNNASFGDPISGTKKACSYR